MADLRSIRARAERAFPGIKPSQALERVRAIVGSRDAIPSNEEGRLAVAALEKLQDPELPEPTPSELAALEFMIRITRPAPLVREGRPENIKKLEQKDVFPDWSTFQGLFPAFAHAIGRVDRAAASLALAESIGTGFLVKPDLLLTNKHVLMQLSRGTGLLEPGQGVVRFQLEAGDFSEHVPISIRGVAYVDPALDIALLSLDQPSLPPGRVLPRIRAAAPPAATEIVVAGYPAQDAARNPLFIGAIFHDMFDVLRVSPGQVCSLAAGGFTHDCSTLGGNSGSPIFDLKTGDVVGLHRSGDFVWANEAVDGASLAACLAGR